ncbi:DUF397 domain-containing protein [Streptomonospora wellingtoniae]|uniref:DUF397 domain-containing protein n=1 Tax=Streptomonospora wellingtoniae TaxID=3075544 RepID=A0ABU2KYU1_9ACTN|nr:DUF397 domain-containing protein [Streptomonospora sp. DSM 45055]MDT0304312.1 DUF397 domain-containing protein [Streptomonospora sp. DSM 45055]
MITDWHTSTYSANGANCVEVRESAQTAEVRDSQHREAGRLSFPAEEWRAFLRDLPDGFC